MKLLGATIITDEIKDNINRLTDYINSNSIHEKRTYIKNAFCRFMDDHIASNYYLDGEPKGDKGIKLSRNIVEIECDLGPMTELQDKNLIKLH